MYYLIRRGKRLIIDTSYELESEVVDMCNADSWLEAKQKFGYPLTPFQRMLTALPGKPTAGFLRSHVSTT